MGVKQLDRAVMLLPAIY